MLTPSQQATIGLLSAIEESLCRLCLSTEPVQDRLIGAATFVTSMPSELLSAHMRERLSSFTYELTRFGGLDKTVREFTPQEAEAAIRRLVSLYGDLVAEARK